MDLNDLLVSYKQVRTPTKPIPAIPVIEQPIYQEAPTVKTEEPLTETADNPTTKYYISSIQAPGFKAKWNSPYKDKNKWATDLANSYRKAGITNDNAIRMLVSQDALESAWGRSAQGKFNFGNLTTGAKWKGDYVTGNDKNAKGEAIKQRFRSYNSMDEYAADKVQFLKRLYDFDENDDINKFTAKLTGANKGKRRYAEATNYADSLTKVFNSFKKGGVIKAQEGFRLNWNPNAGSSIDIVNTAKQYGPSLISTLLTGNPSPLVNKIMGDISNKRQEKPGQVKPLDYSNTFNFIKNLENPRSKGIENGIARNYNKDTAGYGTDFTYGPHRHLKSKILAGKWTEKEARDQAVSDMRTHDKVLMDNMKDYTTRPDTISEGPRLLMAQARYHYGNLKKSFPKWGKAVAEGDAKTQKEQALKLAKSYPDRYKKIQGIQIYGGQK